MGIYFIILHILLTGRVQDGDGFSFSRTQMDCSLISVKASHLVLFLLNLLIATSGTGIAYVYSWGFNHSNQLL